ncbi:unnamed protein product [Haemonchus placei]|uniref:DUF4389 domain-containing protein n=1 Tax=Haemonchus placei TaxID=6290 RepID=A0A0N4W3L8_HAEPC|nr:unnamed protein product [Haemonchus placei]
MDRRGRTGGMDPIMMEFSDVCRHFLGKFGEYLAVIFSVIVLLGGIMVYWVLMSNFLYYTGTVVYAKQLDYPYYGEQDLHLRW